MSDFDLDGFLPYQLAVLSARISRQFSVHYKDRFGLSVAEWRVVAHLAQAGTVSVREIHVRADLEKSKVSRAASRLVAVGYIAKAPNPDDGRLVALSLTDKGRALVAELAPVAKAFEADVLARIAGDAEAFRRAVQTLLSEAKSETESNPA